MQYQQIGLTAVLLIVLHFANSCSPVSRVPYNVGHAKAATERILQAILSYEHEHDGLDSVFVNQRYGECNAVEMSAKLMGANPKGLQFWEGDPRTGFVDPWGMPYRVKWEVTGAEGSKILVWSFGPNQVNENGQGDDISSSKVEGVAGSDFTK